MTSKEKLFGALIVVLFVVLAFLGWKLYKGTYTEEENSKVVIIPAETIKETAKSASKGKDVLPPQEEPDPKIIEEPLLPDLIDSLEEFVSLIKFADDQGITPEEIDGFYFSFVDKTDVEEGVHFFAPRGFYTEYEDEEEILRNALKDFASAKKQDNIEMIPEEELPEVLQTHNKLHLYDADGENTFHKTKAELEAKRMSGQATKEDLTGLSYIYNLQGWYEKTTEIDQENCQKNEERCAPMVGINVAGIVLDQDENPVSGVTVTVLNTGGKDKTTTGSDGTYVFEVRTKALEKIRLRAFKPGYSDGFGGFYVVSDGSDQARNIDFKLNQAQGMAVIDTSKKIAHAPASNLWKNLQANLTEIDLDTENKTSTSAEYKDGKFYISTDLSTYEIPGNAVINRDGTPYLGELVIYAYEFNKSSDIESLLQNDASGEQKEFIGSVLKTFGMPYIQFVGTEGEALYIDRSNPIMLTNQIAEMEALKTAADGIYDPLTDADMEKLVADSESIGGFPINRQYLIDNQMLRFPAFWVFDRNRGMWDNTGIRVIDVGGRIETLFHNIVLTPQD